MAIEYGEGAATLSGVCAVEEAEGLLSWTLQNPEGRVDLSACEHLHTAILQVLLARRPAVTAVPPGGLLRQILQPLMTDTEST